MMIRVNLLPARGATASPLAKWTAARIGWGILYRGILPGVLAAFGIVSLASWRLRSREADLVREIGIEAADSAARSSGVMPTGAITAIADSIESRIRLLRDLDERRGRWPRLLDELGFALPGEAWLVEIASVAPPDSAPGATVLAIRGAAPSTASIAEYVRALERSRHIEGVSFESAIQEAIDGRSVHRFTLGARYEEPMRADAGRAGLPGVPR